MLPYCRNLQAGGSEAVLARLCGEAGREVEGKFITLHFEFGGSNTQKKEFDGILKERDVIPSLNALDSLIRDALERKTIAEQDARSKGQPIEYPTPPHTLSPESLMVAHLGPFLTAQQTTLKATLDILEKQNIALGETIQQQRGEMERLVGSLEDLVGDLKRAAEIVQSDELVGLTSEMREIHEELRDAP